MSTTYAQRQTTAQKKDASSASSVLDASSQSESLQRKADMANNAAQRAEAPRPNNTGMPDNLKSGIESLSGFSMDDVRVHYNSSKPATVQALAYTQGTDIHVAPGQEKCLPHEAWHVAQQMAGRVSPTTNINGMPMNDNAGLEHEADMMGEKATQCKTKNKFLHSQKCPNDNGMAQLADDPKRAERKMKAALSMSESPTLPPTFYQNATQYLLDHKYLTSKRECSTFINKCLVKDPELGQKSIEELILKHIEDLQKYQGRLAKSAKSAKQGRETEEYAATAIEGHANENGRPDVYWYPIPRALLDGFKEKCGISATSDYDFFCHFKSYKNAFETYLKENDYTESDIHKLISAGTPIDVYSAKTLALAGGCAKFNPVTNQLNPMAEQRINELIALCKELGYTPELFFNDSVSEVQINNVKIKYPDVNIRKQEK